MAICAARTDETKGVKRTARSPSQERTHTSGRSGRTLFVLPGDPLGARRAVVGEVVLLRPALGVLLVLSLEGLLRRPPLSVLLQRQHRLSEGH